MSEINGLDDIVAFCKSQWPHARIPDVSIERLIEEYGPDVVESAAADLAGVYPKPAWSLPALQARCVAFQRRRVQTAKNDREAEDARRWAATAERVKHERADPASRARVDQIRAIHADFRAKRIDNREMLRRVAAVVGARPWDKERDAQAADLLVTADELAGAMYGGVAAVAEGRGNDEEVPF